MNLGLQARIALVAGASRGIGLAVASTLHAEGCRVAMAARGREALEAAALGLGAAASAHVADLTASGAATALVERVLARWGRIDVLVCSVGSGASVPPGTETEAEWHRVLTLNLHSATALIAAARPAMRAAGGGAIVCISSICGIAALGAPVTYSAAKAALNATVRGLARPLARDGIRITAVAPGNIMFEGGAWARKLEADRDGVQRMLETEVAQARLGTPAEVADFVAFLASPRAAFVTGSIHVADGGQLRG